jgi:hypothetical protein
MSELLEMWVPECDESDPSYFSDVRTCDRINKLKELAYCLGKTYTEVLEQARCFLRPADHPRGRQYLSGAVAELYAGYKINAPHIFKKAKQPFLSTVLGQVRRLEGGAR